MIKKLSIAVVTITIIAFIISIITSQNVFKSNIDDHTMLIESATGENNIEETINRLQELSVQSSEGTISDTEFSFLMVELNSEVEFLKNKIDSYTTLHENSESIEENSDFSAMTFYMKMAFSIIFCFAALFIVLSNKYDENTKKWAFSVLSLIAGIWIGTIS